MDAQVKLVFEESHLNPKIKRSLPALDNYLVPSVNNIGTIIFNLPSKTEDSPFQTIIPTSRPLNV